MIDLFNMRYPEDTTGQRSLQDALRNDHSDDWGFVVAVPANWVEVVPAPTVGELEGSFPWTFDKIEGVVGDAQRAYYEHDHKREMFHLVMLRAGA